jgi:hypothetical protein
LKRQHLENLINILKGYLSEGQELIVIKTKSNYPFISFFMEQNVVFVYRIETQNYVTLSDLNESGEWQTFELNQGDEFDSFNHEKNKPLEGRGYLIKHSDLKIMSEEINKCIQKHRKFTSLTNDKEKKDERPCAVHLVTSEFLAGSLRFGLGNPKTVIGFPDFFSIGPLWKLDEKIGQTFRTEWLNENINLEQNEFEYENKFTNTLREIEDIPNQAPIYIWYGNNADEQTGLLFLLNLLCNKPNKVFLINSTELYKRYITPKENNHQIFHTGQIEPNDLKLIFAKNSKNQPVSDVERIHFQKEWKTLSQTKEVLRLWSNNEIKGVPENHYDSLIINTIEKMHNKQKNKDFIKTGRVIGEILGEMNGLIVDFFLEYRIRHLIYSGILELKGIPKSMRHYSVKLR